MNKRIEFIDLTKLLAIILIVFSHTGNSIFGDKFNILINSFYITIFFVCTGYTFNTNKLRNYTNLFDTIKKIIKYYLFYSIIILLFYSFLMFIKGNLTFEIIKNGIIGIIYSRYYLWNRDVVIMGIGNAPMWFMTCYILSYSLFFILKKNFKNNDLIISIILIIIGFFLSLLEGLLPWSIDTVPFMTFFIYFGYYIQRKNIINNTNIISVIVMIISFLVLAYFNTPINLSIKLYGLNYFYTLVMSIIGCILFIYISYILCKFKVFNKISMFGRYTLDIMCYHLMVLFIIKIIIPNDLIAFLVSIIIIIGISKYVNAIIKKIVG